MLDKIRTVLIHNSHPGNIGASARALKNMGLESLYLVAPKKFPAIEAVYMASRADDIVERAIVVEKTTQALAECTLVLAASARTRALKWPEISPRQAAEKMMTEIQKPEGIVAILYGCEQHGLSNEELELSHFQIVIPAVPNYSSLNISQAVQLISYEIYLAYLSHQQMHKLDTLDSQVSRQGILMDSNVEEIEAHGTEAYGLEAYGLETHKEGRYATFEEMEGFYKHLEETLIKIKFTEPDRSLHILSRLRRLFGAGRPDIVEINILRGMLKSMQNALEAATALQQDQHCDKVSSE